MTLISIVISVLNGAETLAACLDSILNQSHDLWEILLVDGGSTDGTLDIIDKYRGRLNYSISEPDSGIYNAWNKALSMVRGDWVCFIGCDDTFAAKDSLKQLADFAQFPTVNYVSGMTSLVNANGRQFKAEGVAFNSNDLGKGMKFCHPGSLHHVSLFHEHGLFNEQFKIAGDYEFFLRCRNFIRPAFAPFPVVLMGAGGMSNSQQLRVFVESYRALRDSPDFGIVIGFRLLLVSIVKSILREIINIRLPWNSV